MHSHNVDYCILVHNTDTAHSLMDSALATLRGSGNAPWSLRREVLRTLGILGALDPYKYRQIQNRLRSHKNSGSSGGLVSGNSSDDPFSPLVDGDNLDGQCVANAMFTLTRSVCVAQCASDVHAHVQSQLE